MTLKPKIMTAATACLSIVFLLCALTGCVSKSRFNALDDRVKKLEANPWTNLRETPNYQITPMPYATTNSTPFFNWFSNQNYITIPCQGRVQIE